jgi:hypothetical protein
MSPCQAQAPYPRFPQQILHPDHTPPSSFRRSQALQCYFPALQRTFVAPPTCWLVCSLVFQALCASGPARVRGLRWKSTCFQLICLFKLQSPTMLTWIATVLAAAPLAKALYSNGSVIAPCDSPIYCYGDLLREIELARPFEDSKTFVDLYVLSG